MKQFTKEKMQDIVKYFENSNFEKISFEVLNPDIDLNSYSGEIIKIENKEYIYRSYKSWFDLCEILLCKFLTPIVVNKNIVQLTFKKLQEDDSFHKQIDLKSEKYGVDSKFSLINKSEEASFIYYYTQALKNIDINSKKTILNLGINRADEFEVIKKEAIKDSFEKMSFVGVDFCKSAIEQAKINFPYNSKFYTHDINDLNSLNIGKFDLLISIGTLQSSSLNFKLMFSSLIQEYLNKDSAIILGFPNCRWINGSMVYGAKVKNYSFSELSLLNKDIHFCKKYLQQKKYKVYITGKDYLFLTAKKI